MVEIPTSHVSPESIMTEANSNPYLDQPITKGDASQSEAVSHTPQRILMPLDLDCVAV